MSSYYCAYCKIVKESNDFTIQRDQDYQFYQLLCNVCHKVTIQWDCECCLKQLFCKFEEISEIQKCYKGKVDYRFYNCLYCKNKIFAQGKDLREYTKYTCNICQKYQYYVHCPICNKGYDIKDLNQIIQCQCCNNQFQWMRCISGICKEEAYCLKKYQQINQVQNYRCKGCQMKLLILKCANNHKLIQQENKQLQSEIFCNQCNASQNLFTCLCQNQQYINKDSKQIKCQSCINKWDLLQCPKCIIGNLKYKEDDLIQGCQEQKCIQRTSDTCNNCKTQFHIFYCFYCQQTIINEFSTQHRCQQLISSEQNTNKCTICYTNQLTLLLQPCSHLLFCSPCYTKYRQTKNVCPICKRQIQGVLKIYV